MGSHHTRLVMHDRDPQSERRAARPVGMEASEARVSYYLLLLESPIPNRATDSSGITLDFLERHISDNSLWLNNTAHP